jgi:hypothetical protein
LFGRYKYEKEVDEDGLDGEVFGPDAGEEGDGVVCGGGTGGSGNEMR